MEVENIAGEVRNNAASFHISRSFRKPENNETKVQEKLRKAMDSMKKQKFEFALDLLNDAVMIEPKTTPADVYIGRSKCYIVLGQRALALADAERAVEIAPKDSLTHLQLAHVQLLQGLQTKAFESIQTAAKLDSSNPEVQLLKALLLMVQRNWRDCAAESASLMKSSTADSTQIETAATLLAMSLDGMGQSDASSTLRTILKIKDGDNTIGVVAPKAVTEINLDLFVAHLHNSGEECHGNGDFAKAIALWEAAMLINAVKSGSSFEVTSKSIENKLSRAYRAVGMVEKSLSLSMKDPDSDDRPNYSTMAESFRECGNISRAVELYERALESDKQALNFSGLCTTYNNLACIYFGVGNFSKALTHYSEHLFYATKLQDHSGMTRALNNITHCFTVMKKYSEAQSKLVESFNNHWGVYRELGAENMQGVTRDQYLDIVNHTYTNAVQLYHEAGRPAVALEWAERAKAFSKVDALSEKMSEAKKIDFQFEDFRTELLNSKSVCLSYFRPSNVDLMCFLFIPNENRSAEICLSQKMKWDKACDGTLPHLWIQLNRELEGLEVEETDEVTGHQTLEAFYNMLLPKTFENHLTDFLQKQNLKKGETAPMLILPADSMYHVPWNMLFHSKNSTYLSELFTISISSEASIFLRNGTALHKIHDPANNGKSRTVVLWDKSIHDRSEYQDFIMGVGSKIQQQDEDGDDDPQKTPCKDFEIEYAKCETSAGKPEAIVINACSKGATPLTADKEVSSCNTLHICGRFSALPIPLISEVQSSFTPLGPTLTLKAEGSPGQPSRECAKQAASEVLISPAGKYSRDAGGYLYFLSSEAYLSLQTNVPIITAKSHVLEFDKIYSTVKLNPGCVVIAELVGGVHDVCISSPEFARTLYSAGAGAVLSMQWPVPDTRYRMDFFSRFRAALAKTGNPREAFQKTVTAIRREDIKSDLMLKWGAFVLFS